MNNDADIHLISLSGIRHRCAQESNRFFNRQPHDPRYCYELFRRAIMHQNELAWDFVYQQYQPLVISWIERHSLFPALNEEIQYFINRAFEKMWQSFTPAKFEQSPDLKSVLRYLQMCVHSVITDFARWKEQQQRQESVSLSANEDGTETAVIDEETPEDEIFDHLQEQNFWQWVQDQCNNRQERLVVYASFVLDLPPREVFDLYSEEFDSPRDVSRVKDNFLARMRRNTEFDQFF